MGTSLFFEGERTSLRASLPLAAATRAEREEFFGTRTPQGGFSCRFAAIHLLSSEKTIRIYLPPAGVVSLKRLLNHSILENWSS